MKTLSITMRIGANADEVTVDGVKFDRSKMDRSERNQFRRLVVAGFRQHQEG